MRPKDFGAVCEHGRLARKCERCDDADEIASLRECAKQYERWLSQDHATIADLRDRLRLLSPMVCEECGCARALLANVLCGDCDDVARADGDGYDEHFGACVSVGLRALCGRKLLGGC